RRLRLPATGMEGGGGGGGGVEGAGRREGAVGLRAGAAGGLQGSQQALRRRRHSAHRDGKDPAPFGRGGAHLPVRFAVIGAGATGGFLGAHLARSGQPVTLIARGPRLAAMRRNGVTVRSGEGEFTAHPDCTDDLSAVGDAEVVFLTLKAHAIPALAPAL